MLEKSIVACAFSFLYLVKDITPYQHWAKGKKKCSRTYFFLIEKRNKKMVNKVPPERRRGLKKYGLRKCCKCKEIFPLTESYFFHSFSDPGSSGFDWYCKECHKIINRKYYKTADFKNRFEFLKKYNFTCQYCGRKAPEVEFHIDHIFPKSKGGTSESKNLLLSCDECNWGKGNVTL
jgi:hypothetical protein